MKVSQLIEELQTLKDMHGDLEVKLPEDEHIEKLAVLNAESYHGCSPKYYPRRIILL